MGYYSDVRIKTTKKGFEALKIEIEKYNKENNIKYSALDTLSADKIDTYEDIVTITWYGTKWYGEYDDVKAITKALSKIEEQGFSWAFARIGENYDDIEIEDHIQEDDLWENLYIPICRSFEN